jgi:L-lactate utilization protein LutB
MDQHQQSVVHKKLERTVKALHARRFEAEIVETREDLLRRIKELVPQGASCSLGGSMTLRETGVQAMLEAGDYKYIDRYAKGAVTEIVFHEALNCDVYLMSSNAITEDGLIYNVDGRGNRVAALTYGPRKVIVVAGYNKIVPDLNAAQERVRREAAPANISRLYPQHKTPCAVTGVCEDCRSPDRMCCTESIMRHQREPGRITVLLIPEVLGY